MIEFARTVALDALADEAHARWAMHWDVCPTRLNGRDSWCVKCDELDLAANRAESLARRAYEDEHASEQPAAARA